MSLRLSFFVNSLLHCGSLAKQSAEMFIVRNGLPPTFTEVKHEIR